MELPFMNRDVEKARLQRMVASQAAAFACLYGRRRCGKSRLLREVLTEEQATYYVGDEREPPLQRAAIAAEMARILPAFGDVTYPDWGALLNRWWQEAPKGSVLAIDEFPYLVSQSPELPSLLQKHFDASSKRGLKLILCGSSQSMMHGLVLEGDAPLYGRATEILKLEPLRPGWIAEALPLRQGKEALLAYTLWGGIPRYWELAADHADTWQAYQTLVLDPMGVLHQEPDRLLHEDLRDPAQAISILSLVGQGCHRLSEVAARLEKPASSLSRPFRKLLDLGLLRKEIPFGSDPKKNKQTLYHIRDPFLATWYAHVLPNRSLLDKGVVTPVKEGMMATIEGRVSGCWEAIVRSSLPHLSLGKMQWMPASRWWGTSTDRSSMEVDVVAQSVDKTTLLVGEAKLTLKRPEVERELFELQRKAERLPFLEQYQHLRLCLFVADYRGRTPPPEVVTAKTLLGAYR